MVSIAALLGIGIFVVSQIFGAVPASDSYSATNESHTISAAPSAYFSLSHAQISEEATNLNVQHVYNVSGTEVAASYYNVNGSGFSMNVSGDWNVTTDGSTVNVSYSFSNQPEMARDAYSPIASGFNLGSIIPLVIAAVLVLGYIMRIRS